MNELTDNSMDDSLVSEGVSGVASGIAENIIDVTEQNFQNAVLEESSKRLVVSTFGPTGVHPARR